MDIYNKFITFFGYDFKIIFMLVLVNVYVCVGVILVVFFEYLGINLMLEVLLNIFRVIKGRKRRKSRDLLNS